MRTVDPLGSQRVARQAVWPSGPVYGAKDNRASAAFGHALKSVTYDTNEVETRPRLRSGTGALAMTTPAAAGGLVGKRGLTGSRPQWTSATCRPRWWSACAPMTTNEICVANSGAAP